MTTKEYVMTTQTIELLPVREALLFDIGRYTNVQGWNSASQSNWAGAAGFSAAGNQIGYAVATQTIVVNQV
jgi:hypothetical protein